MLLPWQKAVLKKVTDETAQTKRFFFEVPELEQFNFAPGQFVTFDLPIHEQKNKRWRSYSIASAPDGSNGFELVIVKLEGGMGTAWLWEHGVPGIEISFRGPQGKFVLPESIEEDIYMICTGTGIAPFRSMINHVYNLQLPHQHIYLIFGTRKFGDALYMQEMKSLQQRMPAFEFYPTFSRESADNHLLLRTGYVHSVYQELILRNKKLHAIRGGNGLMPAKFYLCGWKNMIDDARQKIQAIGYDKKDIHFELYG